jgi:hypothetical protein
MAKEPGVLCCCASPPGELNRDLKPHVEDIREVRAVIGWLESGSAHKDLSWVLG